MKIVYNTWFPFGNYHTLNFFGILFTKRKQLPESTITHESIHTAQMKEMLWLFFYLWYGVEYLLIRLFHKKRHQVYRQDTFEKAFQADRRLAHDINYGYIEASKSLAKFLLENGFVKHRIIANSGSPYPTFVFFTNVMKQV